MEIFSVFIPNDILLHIFAFLHPDGIYSCRLTCRCWEQLGRSNFIWAQWFHRFNIALPTDPSETSLMVHFLDHRFRWDAPTTSNQGRTVTGRRVESVLTHLPVFYPEGTFHFDIVCDAWNGRVNINFGCCACKPFKSPCMGLDRWSWAINTNGAVWGEHRVFKQDARCRWAVVHIALDFTRHRVHLSTDTDRQATVFDLPPGRPVYPAVSLCGPRDQATLVVRGYTWDS